MGLIERRVRATIPRDQRQTITRSRYYLRDSYLRFDFRFIEPNLELIEQELIDVLWQRIAEQTSASSVEPFHAFVGLTAFEELCCEWTLVQARARRLPFPPAIVGSHWSSDAQVDVVALNWREKAILQCIMSSSPAPKLRQWGHGRWIWRCWMRT